MPSPSIHFDVSVAGTDLIRRAVEQERERCAAIAESASYGSMPAWPKTAWGEDGYSGGWCEASQRIADSIRNA